MHERFLSSRYLRKTCGETKAVDGVDLSLAAEIVTDPNNGSGKTTFLECVEGLHRRMLAPLLCVRKVHAYGSPLPEGVGVQCSKWPVGVTGTLPLREHLRWPTFRLIASVTKTKDDRGQALRYTVADRNVIVSLVWPSWATANRLPRRNNSRGWTQRHAQHS